MSKASKQIANRQLYFGNSADVEICSGCKTEIEAREIRLAGISSERCDHSLCMDCAGWVADYFNIFSVESLNRKG